MQRKMLIENIIERAVDKDVDIALIPYIRVLLKYEFDRYIFIIFNLP